MTASRVEIRGPKLGDAVSLCVVKGLTSHAKVVDGPGMVQIAKLVCLCAQSAGMQVFEVSLSGFTPSSILTLPA